MNVGTIINRVLNRAGLSVNDYATREMALDFLNEIIQEKWEFRNWGFKKKALTLTTANGTEEYSLDKRARVLNIAPNTMRGTDPVRMLRYEPSIDFYRKRPYTLETSDPYYFRDGVYQGYSNNPSSASVISFVSSLTNYTTGTLTVVKGETRVVIATGSVSVDRLGQGIRIGSDTKYYKIAKIEYNSTSIFYLNEPYQGTSSASATFVIGDIYQRVTVLGYVSGQLQEEEVLLTGSASVSTTKSFTSLVRISKSDKTGGYITATSNSGGVTNAILDPADNSIDVQTVKLYPIPSKTETINYECYIIHPILAKFSDSPLFPQETHELLLLELYIRLEEEWNKREVPESVKQRKDSIFQSMITRDNSSDGWRLQQESWEDSEFVRTNNLPGTYGYDGDFV